MNNKTLELLKKLTKLANHNPNDHEANSAARRVCKMLEDANFNLVATWNDTKKTREPYYPPVDRTPPPNYDPTNINYNDFFNAFFGGRRGGKSDFHNYGDWVTWDTKTQTKPNKEKRTLTCKICKRKVETIFVGLEDVFECNACQWNAYTRSKV